MTATEKLTMLKMNLELLTATQDDYLGLLLDAAAAAMARQGIADDGSVDYEVCQIDYAAYLYRKRAANTTEAAGKSAFAPGGGGTAMPRFLRYNLNNLLASQKIKEAQT